MLASILILSQNSQPSLSKFEGAVVSVQTADAVGNGFVIGKGKYLITCDRVVGSDSKIEISDGTNKLRTGYLMYHDYKLDVSVYRIDKPLAVWLKPATKGKSMQRAFLVSRSQESGKISTESVAPFNQATVDGRSTIKFHSSTSLRVAGAPLLNSDGEIIAMSQIAPEGDQNLETGILAESIEKFLTDKSTDKETTYPGKVVQALDVTRVVATPDLDSRTYFTTVPLQYLRAEDYDDNFMQLTLPSGATGYIRKSMVRVLSSDVVVRSPGVANGYEVGRVIASFDTSSLHPSKTMVDWANECARFVHEVFLSAGRDISTDVQVQMDIGHEVTSIDDLAAGDRVYFGDTKNVRAAIYLGNDTFVSVSKEGKLVKSQFTSTSSKPFYKALH